MIVLDTSVLIDLLRGNSTPAADRLRELERRSVPFAIPAPQSVTCSLRRVLSKLEAILGGRGGRYARFTVNTASQGEIRRSAGAQATGPSLRISGGTFVS